MIIKKLEKIFIKVNRNSFQDNGPYKVENMLCLCPNYHLLFDNGTSIILIT